MQSVSDAADTVITVAANRIMPWDGARVGKQASANEMQHCGLQSASVPATISALQVGSQIFFRRPNCDSGLWEGKLLAFTVEGLALVQSASGIEAVALEA